MDLTMMERVGDIGKNGRIFFNRPKPTVGCSASGRRRRRIRRRRIRGRRRGRRRRRIIFAFLFSPP
jgi:hypothetical protein